jgi:type IV secretion system protein VirB6
MATAFFQGTLGQFASYSSFGNVGSQLGGQDQQAIAQGRQAAGGGGYAPPPNNNAHPEKGPTRMPHLAYQQSGQPSSGQADVRKMQSPTGQGEVRS